MGGPTAVMSVISPREPPSRRRDSHIKSPRCSTYTYGTLPMQHEARPCPPDKQHFQLGWPPTVLFDQQVRPLGTRPGRCLRTQDLTIKRRWMEEDRANAANFT